MTVDDSGMMLIVVYLWLWGGGGWRTNILVESRVVIKMSDT